MVRLSNLYLPKIVNDMNEKIGKLEQTKRTYRGATSTERAETRRQQLIEAAIHVYGELGYHRSTVKSVCASAGLTERYFYEAFDNSEALLAAAFEAVRLEVFTEISSAADKLDDIGPKRAAVMLHAYFIALRRETARARVFLVEMVGISEAIDQVFNSALDKIGELIVEVLDPQHEGPLAGDPLLARGVASGLIGIAVAWVRGGYTEPVEIAASAAIKLCRIAIPAQN